MASKDEGDGAFDNQTVQLTTDEVKMARHLLERLGGSESPIHVSDGGSSRLDCFARATLHIRNRRRDFFKSTVYSEPAFDMLLALYVHRHEGASMTGKRLLDLSRAPPSTANRWLRHLEDSGLVMRSAHPTDGRQFLISLTSTGKRKLEAYLNAYEEAGVAAASTNP